MNNNNNNNNNSTMTMMNAMKRVERLKTQVVVDNAGGGIPMTSTSRLERQETFFSSPWVRVLFFLSLLSLCNGASSSKNRRFLFSFLSLFLSF